jgi:arylsulfatase A
VIHHSISGYFAIRRDNWKLSCCPASGGWTAPKPTAAAWEKFKLEGLPMVQLNDMTLDLGEKTNLALKQPNKVKALRALLDEQIARGRSTPGKSQANDMKIVVDKQPGKKKRTKNKTKGKNKTKEG